MGALGGCLAPGLQAGYGAGVEFCLCFLCLLFLLLLCGCFVQGKQLLLDEKLLVCLALGSVALLPLAVPFLGLHEELSVVLQVGGLTLVPDFFEVLDGLLGDLDLLVCEVAVLAHSVQTD